MTEQDKTTADIIQQAVDVLKIEAEELLALSRRVNQDFAEAVELICRSQGRLVISGIGKSGIVGQKITATLNSTGTRAMFLHPVEALHGDLGMVRSRDVFLGISNSGETEELNRLLPRIREVGCGMIAFTGRLTSTLARQSDLVIDIGVKKEACPLGLAPTSSTTAIMAMGDALAVALINKKEFKATDFQKYHPGGALGQRLASSISEIMLTGDNIPRVPEKTDLIQALQVLDRHELGTVIVTDQDGAIAGILTDGDLRRLIIQQPSLAELTIDDVMIRQPLSILSDEPVYDALNLMEKHEITILPVTDTSGQLCGILHLHDILGKGAFTFNGK